MTSALSEADPAGLAHDIWMKNFKMKLIKEATEPKLYLMSGLPLTGKTHLATRIIERSKASVVYIENDLVRQMIVEHLGLDKPSYTQEEHTLVFDTSHELIWLALSFSFHTIFDATNLNEKYRQKIYDIADAAGAEVLILRLVADRTTAEARAAKKFSTADRKDHSQADVSVYDRMGKEDEPIENSTRQYIVMDTSKESDDELIDRHGLLLE